MFISYDKHRSLKNACRQSVTESGGSGEGEDLKLRESLTRMLQT